MTDTRNRVKLYELNPEKQWIERGSGHVTSSYVDKLKGVSLLIRTESDGSPLLESKIKQDTVYQKQDKLIIWSEGDNYEQILSFQEKAGCDEIWEKICQVQCKDSSVDITRDFKEESEDEHYEDLSDDDTAPPMELPPCEINKLEAINGLIDSCLSSAVRREELSAALEMEGYITKLLNLLHICEDSDNLEGLHHLFQVFTNIFLLNEDALFEVMFAEDAIFDVIACLEYNAYTNVRERFRDYLRQVANFKEVIPITNPKLLAKIHQTYRVQYIQDVVLPTVSVFDEDVVSTLSSFIISNKRDIVNLILNDETILSKIFEDMTDERMEASKLRDLVHFLKELCIFSRTLQSQSRETFFEILLRLDIFPALEKTLAAEDPATKSASIDVLSYIVKVIPSLVRFYMLQQVNSAKEDEHLLLNIVIEQMACSDPELGCATQLSGIVRLLIDPEDMVASINKSEKTDFLNFFYKHSLLILVRPFLANTSDDRLVKEEYAAVQLLDLTLELLSFCLEHGTSHMKKYILHRDLLRRILVLMRSRHTFLVLSALRFFRKIISFNDEAYNHYIVKSNLFAPVVDAFLRNNGRYNLLDSAILELFEYIKIEDVKSLRDYIVETFGKALDKVEYVQTFKCLRLRYDQEQDRAGEVREQTTSTPHSVLSLLKTTRFRRDPRQLEEEEELSDDDDGNENGVSDGVSTSASQPSSNSLLLHQQQQLLTPPIVSSSPTSPKSSIAALATAFSPKSSPAANGGVAGTFSSSSGLSPATSPMPFSAGVQSPPPLKKDLVDYESDSETEATPAVVVVPVEESAAFNNNGIHDDTVASTTVPDDSISVGEDKIVKESKKDEIASSNDDTLEADEDEVGEEKDVGSPNKRAKLT